MPTNDDQASAATFAGRGLLTVTEAAHWLHFSRNTVYRLIYAGEIPTITFGANVRRIRVSDLEAWAERNVRPYVAGEGLTHLAREGLDLAPRRWGKRQAPTYRPANRPTQSNGRKPA